MTLFIFTCDQGHEILRVVREDGMIPMGPDRCTWVVEGPQICQAPVQVQYEDLTPEPASPLVKDMEQVPHPRTQFFMGWEDSQDDWNRKADAAEADDVYLERVIHIWPLMGYYEADARWKLGQTAEVVLYALCGIRLRDYVHRYDDNLPVQFGEHWIDGSRDVCEKCAQKWEEQRRLLS